jgi:hypothetical protein
LQEKETWRKEAEATEAHNQMSDAKRDDAGLCFANVDRGIASRCRHRREFQHACSEYEGGCVFIRDDDVINACSELLRQDFESQRDEDCSGRTKGARVSVLLDSPEELFLWRDSASHAKYRVKFPCGHQYSLGAVQPICPTVHLQLDASPERLGISTALILRELLAADGEHLRSVKKLAINNIKRFSHHRGKDEIRQNAEAQFWNGLVSEFVHDVIIKVLELISVGIRHFCIKT